MRIKSIKKLLTISIGAIRLSPVELQTALFEIANLTNERPIGVVKTPNADGIFKVLTPNALLMGRSLAAAPDDTLLGDRLQKSERYKLIQQVTAEFWSRWATEVIPQSILRQKWHQSGRDLKKGDLVLIHDSSPFKGKYVMGVVEDVVIGKDERVRSCSVSYVVPGSTGSGQNYSRGKHVIVKRSIQKLTLLLSVEEQEHAIEVEGDVVKLKV